MKERLLYAGSFDPITNGHLDLIHRGSKLCEHMIVGLICNPSKRARYSVEERTDMLRLVTARFGNVEIDSFYGLLADYVREKKINIVLRGLRATTDFEYEIQMAQMNARLYNARVETIFLMTSPDYSFVSSSLIAEVFSLGGDISGLVPEPVLSYMKKAANRTGGNSV
jgi:pantetheine-phosphate adenylyltransferase